MEEKEESNGTAEKKNVHEKDLPKNFPFYATIIVQS